MLDLVTVLRYQLSADPMVTYAQIIDQAEALFPSEYINVPFKYHCASSLP